MATTTQTTSMFNPFQMAAESVQATLQAGMKFQQDAARMMGEGLFDGKMLEDSRRRFETMTTESMDLFRKNAERTQKMVEENTRRGLDLMRQGFETAMTGMRSGDDFRRQAQDLWHGMFETLRTNTDAFVKNGTQAVEGWSSCVQKASGERTGKAAGK